MDRDGWERTQTLDRYLDLIKLPQRPRWQQVSATVKYVLNQLHSFEKRAELQKYYDRFPAT